MVPRGRVKREMRLLLAEPSLARFHQRLAIVAQRSLGILNYQDDVLSGERHLLSCLAAASPAAITVLDVGAHHGDYAEGLRAVLPAARIYAMEPHPRAFERLQERSLVGGFAAIQVGCSNASRIATLVDYPDTALGSQHATLHLRVMTEVHQSETTPYEVRLVTLDDLCDQLGITSVDFLKIDTEGHELAVLEGASSLLERGLIQAVQFEFNEMNVYSRVFMRDFVDLLPEFELFRVLPRGFLPLLPYNPLRCEVYAYQNVLAVRHANAGLLDQIRRRSARRVR